MEAGKGVLLTCRCCHVCDLSHSCQVYRAWSSEHTLSLKDPLPLIVLGAQSRCGCEGSRARFSWPANFVSLTVVPLGVALPGHERIYTALSTTLSAALTVLDIVIYTYLLLVTLRRSSCSPTGASFLFADNTRLCNFPSTLARYTAHHCLKQIRILLS